MPTIELDTGIERGELHYQVLNPEGEETIIMIHGMFGNLSQFYLTLSPYLSVDYRVIMYDLRSHGRSTCFSYGFDLMTLANDLNILIQKLEIKRCHLIGFSYGALIALKFAMHFKEKVDKVVAVEIPPRPDYPMSGRGSFTFQDFICFAEHLSPNVRVNFLRSNRQIKNNYRIYEFIINQTTFIDDMNKERKLEEKDYQMIEAPVQLFFGDNSVCLPELERVQGWLTNKVISLGHGDHGFFMQNSEVSANEMIRFLKAKDLTEVYSFNYGDFVEKY